MNRSEWKTVPIREVYEGLFDGPHATPNPSDSGPIFLGISNITDDGCLDLSDIRHIAEEEFGKWTRRVEPRAGDLVFTYEATLNRYALVPNGFRGCLGRRMALIRPDTAKVDVRYLFYYFFSSEWRAVIASKMMSGATVDRIPLITFPEFPVRIPPLPVQRQIADILSAYDDLIENNTRRIHILEQQAQALYREWFVNFRFPGHAKVKLVDSTLGKIPQGWQPGALGNIAGEVRRGVNPDEIEPETPYIGLEHMPRKSIALAEWGTAKEVQSTKLAFKKGEILFGKIRPYFHKVGVAMVDGVCSTDAIVIIPKQAEHFALVLACVSSEAFVSHATQTSQGTKMPRANWDILTKYPLPVPPSPLLALFSDSVEQSVSLIENLAFKNRKLRRTRDLLLPRLLSGDLDVSKLDTETI